MKKLLTILGALSLSATSATLVVACGPGKVEGPVKIKDIKPIVQMGEFESKDPAELKTLITNKFFELNKAKLPEGSTIKDLYVATAKIDVEKKIAWVTGSNQGNNLISSELSDGIEVSFSISSTAPEVTKVNLKDIEGIKLDLGEIDASYKGDQSKADYKKVAQEFFNQNKDNLPSGTLITDIYVNGYNLKLDKTTNSWTGTVTGDKNSTILTTLPVTIKFTIKKA